MNTLEPQRDSQIKELLAKETALAVRLRDLEVRYSGLRDLDLSMQLIALRLRIATALLEKIQRGDPGPWPESSKPTVRDSAGGVAREKALAALQALEELRRLNLSEDQKGLPAETPFYAEVKALLERFVALGGGALLDQREPNERKNRIVARTVAAALGKFVAPDDSYRQVFKTEQLPPLLRRLVGFFWPLLAREKQQDPPYGIAEGEEVLLSSERMKMPLSQAVYYLETELLPRLEQELAKDLGNPYLQRRIRIVQERLREYKNIRTIPRATPINLEHGFYTDWLSHYTADGELLVTVDLPVKMLSGTNLDRLREYVQDEVVRRLAGKGVCPELDADYRFRKSLESGRRGSSRVPSRKVDIQRGFMVLAQDFPVLRRLEDRRQLQQLVELVRAAGVKKTQKVLEQRNHGDLVDGRLERGLAPPGD